MGPSDAGQGLQDALQLVAAWPEKGSGTRAQNRGRRKLSCEEPLVLCGADE